MLKHMLNTSAVGSSSSSSNSNVNKQNGFKNITANSSNGSIMVTTGIPQSQLQQPVQTVTSSESSDCGRIATATTATTTTLTTTRYYVEPEYQNTTSIVGRVYSPSSSPFYRDIQLNKSARSAENVCGVVSSDSSYKYNQWNHRLTPNRTTCATTTTSTSATTLDFTQYPNSPICTVANNAICRLPSRNSIQNHSYAPGTFYHPHYQQRSFSPNCQQRLNQSEIIATIDNGLVINSKYNVDNANHLPNSLLPNGYLVSTPKVVANGGLHISKSIIDSNNKTNKDSLSLDCSRVNNAGNVITTAAVKKRDDDDGGDNNNNNNNGNDDNRRNGRDVFNRGVKEILTSLGLLCLISLLLALLSLIFLLKISPVTATDMKNLLRVEQFTIISPDEYVTVYEVTLALCALSLSLNLCCLLVCSVQFLFAVKLVRSSVDGDRTNKYLQKSAVTRVCAIAGFFISIPVFLTGVILYTFIQFHSTPAIITSVLIGSGIVFCGCAMVHNVFIWQKEKTNAVRAIVRRQRLHRQMEASRHSESSTGIGVRETSATAFSTMSSLPRGGPVELSSVATTPHELSTLV